jgi:hypothetical protein
LCAIITKVDLRQVPQPAFLALTPRECFPVSPFMGRSRQEAGRQRQRRGPRASQACDNCATAKARCDNNECCQRCRRRDLPCIRPTPLYEKPIMRIVSSRKTSPASQCCTGESRNFDGPRDLFPEIVHDCMQRDLPSSLSVESSGHTLGKSTDQTCGLARSEFHIIGSARRIGTRRLRELTLHH